MNTYVGTWIQCCLCKILHISSNETALGHDKKSFSIISLLLLFTWKNHAVSFDVFIYYENTYMQSYVFVVKTAAEKQNSNQVVMQKKR